MGAASLLPQPEAMTKASPERVTRQRAPDQEKERAGVVRVHRGIDYHGLPLLAMFGARGSASPPHVDPTVGGRAASLCSPLDERRRRPMQTPGFGVEGGDFARRARRGVRWERAACGPIERRSERRERSAKEEQDHQRPEQHGGTRHGGDEPFRPALWDAHREAVVVELARGGDGPALGASLEGGVHRLRRSAAAAFCA